VPDARDPLARLTDAVDALTEVNYPGGEFESLIDELDVAFRAYRSQQDTRTQSTTDGHHSSNAVMTTERNTMNTPHVRRAQDGEVYVALADTTAAFPAVIDDKRWNGFVRPRFTRDTAQVVAAWLNTDHPNDPMSGNYNARFDGDTLIVTDLYEGTTDRIHPDTEGRYSIGAGGWMWELSIPVSDVAAEAALLADAARLIPEDTEIRITIGATGNDPVFPAVPDPDFGWSRAGTPRFRREIAEVVVAWLNDTERRFHGGGVAYWDGETLVRIDLQEAPDDGYLPARITPDDDGRYAIGPDFEWERVADNRDTD
jgi:hypothetical protein